MSQKLFRIVCIPVVESTASKMLAALKRAMHRARWIELRLEYLKSARELDRLIPVLERMNSRRHEFIFTLRRSAAGGRFKGTFDEQRQRLEKFAALGRWVDVEIDTLDSKGFRTVGDLGWHNAKIIVSYHNLHSTPANLRALAQKLDATGADMIKIATQANSLSDAARLLELQGDLHRQRRPSVILGMGPCGLVTRILGPSRGAKFTFAPLQQGKQSAPGQLTFDALKNTFRLDRIDSRTQIFGLLGHPVGHSLSPALYNAAFARLGMNAVYLPFECPDLDDFCEWSQRLNVRGLSVTLPHKIAVMRFLSSVDSAAQKIGAVNTVRLRKGRWRGWNTDALGILQPLREMRLPLRGTQVLLLGAGGAAQAAAAALAGCGAQILICNRTHSSAQRLARRLGCQTIRLQEIKGRRFDLLINATSVGMWPKINQTPIGFSSIRAKVVFDMVYNPADTRLLRTARRHHARTISGWRMFIAQARAQFRILTGRSLPHSVWRDIDHLQSQ